MDYLLWQFEERVELIKGKIFKMSPASSRKYQGIPMSITLILAKFLKDQDYKMYATPFDVRLINYKASTNDNQIISVVQPDLIIEILSPGNYSKEMDIKFDLYQEKVLKNIGL